MDGLVSNAALIAGVAGGGAAPRTVVLAGVAGLASGAFSMAAGEYTSVASQRELTRAELDVERRELLRNPEAERAELAAVYVARGVDPDLADRVAAQLSRDPEQALEVHAREELGVDPGDLPSPALAAGSSFASFALGALVPLLPYLLGARALALAVAAALAGLFLCGAVVGRITARPWWWTGGRQLVLGALAAGLSWLLGGLVGAGLG
ncbi:hypothetical protein D5H78_15370 [Vallicoccus soli]|uniref:VIT family protein n=2 Tax=Vallicoccus soli TaxID=2339232 RepID=A0A3A3ZFI6_9ACTN|nr:hypothetical protein D5H78_15370 [Vallicoccus soli]